VARHVLGRRQYGSGSASVGCYPTWLQSARVSLCIIPLVPGQHHAGSIALVHFSESAWIRAVYINDTSVGFLTLYILFAQEQGEKNEIDARSHSLS
jgi:hypothetical protein